MLSEADRDAANRYLTNLASDGTRDELGFAPIHFAFADRFFPGTSVQHANLRYVFFVAWSYQEMLASAAGERFSRETLSEIERRYSVRLMNTLDGLRNSGISGWTKYQTGESPVVRASTIYWTALRSWRMASAVPGRTDAPTEVQLQGVWPRLVTRDDGDMGKARKASLFHDLPPPPPGWANKSGALDFHLRPREAEYIRRKWLTAGEGGTQPLLSRLAEADVTTESLWSGKVTEVADAGERKDLLLAKRAASVACVGRAAYAALVESRRNEDRGLKDDIHLEALPVLRSEHRDAILALDTGELRDAAKIDGRLIAFVEAIVDWVRHDRPLDAMGRILETRERDLKGSRAYLLNEKRRGDWRKGIATPLDYRWPVVREMIECVRSTV